MRKLLNELSPELRNRAARKATLDSDRGNIQGLTAAKRKIQASKFLELPSQLKNFADRICDKMQEYFTGMEIHSYKDNKTKFDIGKVRVYTFEKFIDTNSYSTHIDLLIVMGTNQNVKALHRYMAETLPNSSTILDNESDEVFFNNELKRQFRIGTQELPLENNGVSQREIIGMLMNLHKKINVELKQSVKQNENMKKSSRKLRTENTIKGVTLNEIKRMQQLAGILPLNESSAKINEASNNKHVWEGWTVQDFIDELEPTFDSIMKGNSYMKPPKNDKELKDWLMDNQPYYKKHIPDVFKYFKNKMSSKINEGNLSWKEMDRYAKAISNLTGTDSNAVKNFIEDNDLDAKKLYSYAKSGKSKDRMNFATALVGNPGNKYEKMIITKFGLKESINEAKVNKKYTHFIVDKKTNKILNGFDYKGLDNSSIQDYFMEDLKDMGLNKRDVSLSTAKSLMSKNIDPFDKSNWSN